MQANKVLQFLRDNPRFMRRHQAELGRMLRLAERDIIDLTGRQLLTLRDENTGLRRRLLDWYDNATSNDTITFFLHRLAVRLLAARPRPGATARTLAVEAKGSLGVEMCRLVDLDAAGVDLAAKDKKQLLDCAGALRTTSPLPSLAAALKRSGDWGAYLHIPVLQRSRLRAVVVFATSNARDFPKDASTDYATDLAELVAASLAREK